MSEQPAEVPRPDPVESGVSALFSYRGRIGRGGYWLGLLICVVVLVGAMMFLASAMNPTGGGAPFLALPLAGLFFWIHSALVIKRFRDAGWSPWLYIVFGLGPFVWLALTLELIEFIGPIIAIGFFGLLAVPGIIPTKADETPAAS